jgi:hypothetical protein
VLIAARSISSLVRERPYGDPGERAQRWHDKTVDAVIETLQLVHQLSRDQQSQSMQHVYDARFSIARHDWTLDVDSCV